MADGNIAMPLTEAERVNLWCKYQMTEILDDVILGNADVCLLIFDLG